LIQISPGIAGPEEDLHEIVNRLSSFREMLAGRRIFVTGGTGFIGRWLVESFVLANTRLGLGGQMTVLSRDPKAFGRRVPHLTSDRALTFVAGDVRTFDFQALEGIGGPPVFDLVIHAAAPSSEALNLQEPLTMMDIIIEGTRRVLDFADRTNTRRMLFLSSGAVYGRQPPGLARTPEDYLGGPDLSDARSAYAEAKRLGELLCAGYHQERGLDVMIARGFAFVGPHLPLDRHFAAGNFLCDALEGRPIQVRGDGTARRSYMYASDLALWLWTLLLTGSPGRAYNVGSETEVSIADLARETARLSDPPLPVQIAGHADATLPPERYVPSTWRARSELGLTETIDLPTALQKTYRWHRLSASGAIPAGP
jgi:dTDP-glucose 4,6-dehydratase